MRLKNFTYALLLVLFVVSAATVRPQSNTARSFEPPRDGQEWFARGHQLHNSDRYPEAIESFKRAMDLGYRKTTAMYNIACGYSLLNDKDNALEWLQRAIDNGFDNSRLVADDSDLDPLRTDARFKKLLSSVVSKDPSASDVDDKNWKRDRVENANIDYVRLEGQSSTDGKEWAKVGMRLVLLRDLDRSIVALGKAINLLEKTGDASASMYNLACAYSLKGDREAGIQWLEKSVKAGFDSPQKLKNDPDINSLRSDSRFARIEKLSNTLSLSQFRDPNEHGDKTNYSKQRWAPAINLYESFVKTEPGSGRAWYNLGYALHYSSEHARAIKAFERAIALAYHIPTSTYNIACAYAMLNDKDAAFEWLDRAIEAGFDSRGDMSWDRDLDNLRADPRFKRFAKGANYSTKINREYEW